MPIEKGLTTPEGIGLEKELRKDVPKVTITETEDTTTGMKTYTVHGNLILDKDFHYVGNLVVEGSIFGIDEKMFSLTVEGNIKALDIRAGDIDAENIDARDIDAWGIDAKDINAEDINASGKIKAWDIKAEDIAARDIDAWGIAARDIAVSGNINARNIAARDIDAENIKVSWGIKAGNIKAWDIDAYNINARNIAAGDIETWDINAWNIRAGDINAEFILCETLNQKEGSVLTVKSLKEHRSETPLKVIPRPGNREVPEKT